MEPLKTIAFVDDEAGIIQVLQLACQSNYTLVGTARNGNEAVELVKRTKPNVLIMDIHMPGLDGLQALQQIVALRTTAVVMMTADQSPEVSRQAMDLGASGYIIKPFECSQMAPAMESAWHSFQTVNALEEQTRALTENLEVRKLLEKAKGILMEQQGFTEQDAHRTIQKMAQDQGITVKELCRALIQVRMVLGGKSRAGIRPRNAA